MTLPNAPVSVQWEPRGTATAAVTLANRSVPMVLDTGFPRTAIAANAAGGLDLSSVSLSFAGALAGPMPVQWLLSGLGPAGVLGSDVLHQLPLLLDPVARTAEVLPAFLPPASETLLRLADPGACAGGATDRRAPLFFVTANVEGEVVDLVVDTGAEMTFISTDLASRLGSRPTLGLIRVASGFAGIFTARAVRARLLEVGSARVVTPALLSSAEVDAELARLTRAVAATTHCNPNASCSASPTFDGFLGWTFLREFKVSLAEGSPYGERRLGLERPAGAGLALRDFVGVGWNASASDSPPGLRVDSFLSVSPAEDAGVKVGDVVTAIDGQPAATVSPPYAAAGTKVKLALVRDAAALELDVTVADLLADPPVP